MPLLHQPPPDPWECQQSDSYCKTLCKFHERCRQILKNRYSSLTNESLREIKNNAIKNSLGCLEWEGYTPDK